MVNLVIDIGNTFTKAAIFNNRKLIETVVFKELNTDDLDQFGHFDNSILSSVEQDSSQLEAHLKSRSACIRFRTDMYPSVINHYKTPQTLGLDRFAGVIGAAALYPEQNSLVIDAGTCITYDLIDKNRNYYGGCISPGLSMRFQAMHELTEKLPLIAPDLHFMEKIGTDTRSSLLAGAQQGLINEALGFINDYELRFEALQIILCGGDFKFFDTRLKNSIFAHSVKVEPHLVLIGLNEVIHQQYE